MAPEPEPHLSVGSIPGPSLNGPGDCLTLRPAFPEGRRGAFTFRALRPRPAQGAPPLPAALEIISRPRFPDDQAWGLARMAVNHGGENCFETRDAL